MANRAKEIRDAKAKKFVERRHAGAILVFGHLQTCQRVKDMHHRNSACTCGRVEHEDGYGR